MLNKIFFFGLQENECVPGKAAASEIAETANRAVLHFSDRHQQPRPDGPSEDPAVHSPISGRPFNLLYIFIMH